jgi:hypothetical protein
MFNDWRNILVALLMVVLLAPFIGGASCNTQSVLDTIRDVHTGVREAGRLADEQIAPRLENHGDTCIARADAAGLTGAEGMESWRECMSTYLQLDTAVTSFRNSMEELENVYQDIEAGTRGETDWRYWAARVLDHGRTIMRLVRELDVGIDSDVLRGLQTNLDSLCGMLGCDEEATS